MKTKIFAILILFLLVGCANKKYLLKDYQFNHIDWTNETWDLVRDDGLVKLDVLEKPQEKKDEFKCFVYYTVQDNITNQVNKEYRFFIENNKISIYD